MKRIEAGCRAVIVNSVAGNDGILVTVIGAAPDNDLMVDARNRWYVDKKIKSIVLETGETFPSSCTIAEVKLQRIDDDQQKLGSWYQIEADCGYFPNRELVID